MTPGRVSLAVLAAVLALALPRAAAACATCISSPFGDRTYNLAYLGLILTPFVVALAIGAVLTGAWWHARRQPRPDAIDSRLNEETR